MRRRPISVIVAIAASAVVLLIGMVMVLIPRHSEVSFGWTAYTPLSDATFGFPGFTILTRGELIGLGIMVVGIVGLAICAGCALGRRSQKPE